MNVLMDNFIDIAGRLHIRRPWRFGEYRLWPPAATHEVGKLVNAYAGMA
jgi:hypothetical protein